MTQREFFALRDVCESRQEQQFVIAAQIQASLYNAWGRKARASDFYTPRKRTHAQATHETVDPRVPQLVTQTLEEQRFAIRQALTSAADVLPESQRIPPMWHEIPEGQRAAVESLWQAYSQISDSKPD